MVGLQQHCRCPTPQAKANRGILYVDEVNLLDDGLVDVVLDSAASGLNTVEREGISIVHPAKVPFELLHHHRGFCILHCSLPLPRVWGLQQVGHKRGRVPKG